ncbi:hypothetical protein EZV62_008849 [Acer yangbiense]|uniref:NADH dehydrogenase [ubiquinone] 1 alpha subcomplex subunit 12 n=1 Tax=Acer yangbiense TaxID=1000413 RepID=A0A5C7IF02_9ROSI|nr:hypothetical protein EZV62_008849 [Acer yangbiense]
MSKLLSRIAGFFSNRSFAGVDKTGNRYFSRTEEIDGLMKEKRWVMFKGEQDPTSIPVEWICWLNGQRKKAPTPEEMAALEAKREQVKLNVARKVGGLDLKSFIQQFEGASEGLPQDIIFPTVETEAEKSEAMPEFIWELLIVHVKSLTYMKDQVVFSGDLA